MLVRNVLLIVRPILTRVHCEVYRTGTRLTGMGRDVYGAVKVKYNAVCGWATCTNLRLNGFNSFRSIKIQYSL